MEIDDSEQGCGRGREEVGESVWQVQSRGVKRGI